MSHTLHRHGTRQDLERDFVLFMIPAQRYNRVGHTPKLQKFIGICEKYKPINMGEGQSGNLINYGFEGLKKNPTVITQVLFNNKEALAGALKEVVEYDCGLSVDMSGLFDELFECCRRAGIDHPNCLEQSLGVLGKTEKLPDPALFDISTMCGHGQVSDGLVGMFVERIKRGEMSPEEAGWQLGRPCSCGVFNQERAAELLRDYCAQVTTKSW